MLRAQNLIIALISASLSMTIGLPSHSAEASDKVLQFSKQRTDYLAAKKAWDKKNLSQYAKLRAKLDNYPLSIYLDYHADSNKIMSLDGLAANEALTRFSDSPLYSSLKHKYLLRTGKKQQWNDFLSVAKTLPRDTKLQCYFHRAQLAKGETEQAYSGAKRLWLHGKSRPKACDPLFKAWSQAGERSQELIWQRLLLAFDARQYGLVKYLARKVTSKPDTAKTIVSVYQDPQRLRHTKNFKSKQSRYGEIVFLGIKRLARRDLSQAVKLYTKYLKLGRFSQYQQLRLARYLTRRALVRKETALKPFIDAQLSRLASDELYEMRIRWSLKDSDLATAKTLISAMSAEQQQSPRWQYWHQKLSDEVTITANQESLAKQRNFYGFVAADALKQPISLNNETAQALKELPTKLKQSAGLQRINELLALDKQVDARAEWLMLLQSRSREEQVLLGQYAIGRQWHSLSVQASISAKQWNDMAMRFPFASTRSFEQASKRFNVDIDEIRAIARRESAFYPSATSGVGARGMMQLMPTTAKQTAKKHKFPYKHARQLYNADLNIQLGSAYYASVLKQFNNNRILASAAYNAGPHRVKRWLKRSKGTMDLMTFIETIPFRETREYVQAVISYRAIYQTRQNKAVKLFTDEELNFKY